MGVGPIGAGLSAGSTDENGRQLPDYRSAQSFAETYPHLGEYTLM